MSFCGEKERGEMMCDWFAGTDELGKEMSHLFVTIQNGHASKHHSKTLSGRTSLAHKALETREQATKCSM